MIEPIELRACLIDPPWHRDRIESLERIANGMDIHIRSILKHTRSGHESGQDYSRKNQHLATSMRQFAHVHTAESKSKSLNEYSVPSVLEKFADCISEIESHRLQFFEQVQGVFVDPVNQFVQAEVQDWKDSRKRYERAQDEHENSCNKYSSKRPRDTGINEAAQELADARREYHQQSLNYSQKLNDLQEKQHFVLVENFLGYMYAQFAFYHQQYDLFKDLEPFMRSLSAHIHSVRQSFESSRENVQLEKQALVDDAIRLYHPSTAIYTSNADGSVKSGYLFKKGSQRMRQVWNRRFFTVRGHELVYYTRGKTDEAPVVALDLRLCSVKLAPADSERRFCFEVISPMKSYLLQAENDEEVQSWITILQSSIGAALNQEILTPRAYPIGSSEGREEANQALIEAVLNDADDQSQTLDATTRRQRVLNICSIPGNNICADCGSPDPDWCSINLGTIICIDCSGIHRSLGVHFSKVRSLTLDHLESDILQILQSLGNEKVNGIFEQHLEGRARPQPKSDRGEKEQWILNKYVAKAFLTNRESECASQEQLQHDAYVAVKDGDFAKVLRCLALGAEIDGRHDQGCTLLHAACASGNSSMCNFLLLWPCNVDILDDNGWTPMHHAAANNCPRIVVTLIKRHARYDVADKTGLTPCDVALNKAHVSVVTILRLFRFEAEQNKTAITPPTVTQTHSPAPSRKETEKSVPPDISADNVISQTPRSDVSPSRVATLAAQDVMNAVASGGTQIVSSAASLLNSSRLVWNTMSSARRSNSPAPVVTRSTDPSNTDDQTSDAPEYEALASSPTADSQKQ